jgi:hypothetical protein
MSDISEKTSEKNVKDRNASAQSGRRIQNDGL